MQAKFIHIFETLLFRLIVSCVYIVYYCSQAHIFNPYLKKGILVVFWCVIGDDDGFIFVFFDGGGEPATSLLFDNNDLGDGNGDTGDGV
mmetsp:Transcript_49241/g.73267  ORF Transcript_49241/g.73267 Transcript_49241/m.73267 type:complete len:89 (+) Transcript_49241:90-356(+)